MSTGNGSGSGSEADWEAADPGASYRTGSLVTVLLIPLVVGVGLFGNVVTTLVYLAPRMRQLSVNVLLGGLAISDTAMLVGGVLVMFPMGLYNELAERTSYQTYVAWATKLGYPIAVAAQLNSVYVLILITLERYLAVCHPLRAKVFCTTAAAWTGLAVTATLSMAYNACRFWEHSIVNSSSVVPLLKASDAYNLVYGMYLELVVSCVVPFTLLCVLNARIIQAVNAASRLRRISLAVQRHLTKPKKFQTTWMMVVVIVVFLVSNSLSFALAIIEVLAKESVSADLGYFLIDLSNLLVQSNAAFNFAVYLIFSATYRRLFRRRFSCVGLENFGPSVRTIFRTMESQHCELELVNSRSLALLRSRRSDASASEDFSPRPLPADWEGERGSARLSFPRLHGPPARPPSPASSDASPDASPQPPPKRAVAFAQIDRKSVV